MRMRVRNEDDVEVAMSPLIDCVFLLLIFFLVTSIIKRKEQQIPVTLADPTAAVATEGQDDALRIGIDTDGNHFRENGQNSYGQLRFTTIPDLPVYLRDLAATRGADATIELVVERRTPFQKVIDTLDVFELQGFDNVRSRVTPEKLKGGK